MASIVDPKQKEQANAHAPAELSFTFLKAFAKLLIRSIFVILKLLVAEKSWEKCKREKTVILAQASSRHGLNVCV